MVFYCLRELQCDLLLLLVFIDFAHTRSSDRQQLKA